MKGKRDENEETRRDFHATETLTSSPLCVRFPPGIVSLLFCGITLKHYAYHSMSRRTQRTTKYMFAILAQLSENFIFIYLGLNLL